MNRNTILLLLAFVGMGAATYYFSTAAKGGDTINATDKEFTVPQKDLYKIFVANRDGKRITLTRVGHSDQWQVNGKYPANAGVMTYTMEVLTKAAVKYVPPRASVSTAAQELAVSGLKVELYGLNEAKLKTFYIGGTTIDGHGTYFIMEGSEQPYVMEIPGFVGEIRPRFSLDEETWRDKTIFAEPLESIAAISVDYPAQKQSAFKINRGTLNYEVLPFYDGVPRTNNELSKGVVRSYLTNFERVIAEGFDNTNKNRDSISRMQPFAVINVKNNDGKEKIVRIFPIFEKDAMGRPLDKKPDRYFAETNNGDFMLIQDVVFRKLLYDYKAFFK